MVGKLNICSGFYGALNISDSKNDKFQLCSLSHVLAKFTCGSRRPQARGRTHTHTHTNPRQCNIQTQIHVHFLAFRIFNIQQIHKFKYYKPDHKTHFLLAASSYTFRQYGAIAGELFSNEVQYCAVISDGIFSSCFLFFSFTIVCHWLRCMDWCDSELFRTRSECHKMYYYKSSQCNNYFIIASLNKQQNTLPNSSLISFLVLSITSLFN
jgi:hypothetical protein